MNTQHLLKAADHQHIQVTDARTTYCGIKLPLGYREEHTLGCRTTKTLGWLRAMITIKLNRCRERSRSSTAMRTTQVHLTPWPPVPFCITHFVQESDFSSVAALPPSSETSLISAAFRSETGPPARLASSAKHSVASSSSDKV